MVEGGEGCWRETGVMLTSTATDRHRSRKHQRLCLERHAAKSLSDRASVGG